MAKGNVRATDASEWMPKGEKSAVVRRISEAEYRRHHSSK